MLESEEALQRLRNVGDLLAGVEVILSDPTGPLRYPDLLICLQSFLEPLSEAVDAATALSLGYPIAEEFPDGGQAPAVLTPRQALYLIATASGLTITNLRRQIHGLPPTRKCSAFRQDGEPCKAMAMPHADRPVCASHATPEERLVASERKWASPSL